MYNLEVVVMTLCRSCEDGCCGIKGRIRPKSSLKRFDLQIWLPILTLLWGVVSLCPFVRLPVSQLISAPLPSMYCLFCFSPWNDRGGIISGCHLFIPGLLSPVSLLIISYPYLLHI